MAGASQGYHELLEKLSPTTQDFHRALVSLQEELEAVDWYQQRADACENEELRAILLHNMQEEMEHASMLLEWLRRQHPAFEKNLRHYLFQEGSIVGREGEANGETKTQAEATLQPGLTVGTLKGA